METFVTFGYVYGAPDRDTRYFRFMVWKAAGLSDRQSFKASVPKYHAILATEAAEIKQLLTEIQAQPHFQTLDKAGKGFITGKRIEWHGGKSWAKIAGECGIHSGYFQVLYDYMCSYSHASFLAVLQMGQADFEQEKSMATSMLMALNVFMCHFAVTYVKLFPETEAAFKRHEQSAVFKRWHFDKATLATQYGPELP
jgi:hypothetical protein